MFLHRDMLATLLAEAALGELPAPPPCPPLRDKMRVRVVRERLASGEPFSCDVTWTTSPPILAHDGRWMIAVFLLGRGVVFVPCDDCLPKE